MRLSLHAWLVHGSKGHTEVHGQRADLGRDSIPASRRAVGHVLIKGAGMLVREVQGRGCMGGLTFGMAPLGCGKGLTWMRWL